jgi:signal peptidase I
LDQEHIVDRDPPWWVRLTIGRRPLRTLVRLVILVVSSWILFTVVLLPVRIEGISMLPTYRSGKIDCVNRSAYWWRPIQRGDIVGVRYGRENRQTLAGSSTPFLKRLTSNPSVMLLKRVIALPGEQVGIQRGVVYINDQPLEEPYVKLPREPWNRPAVTLRPNEYLVIGDNRSMPMDQHEFGEVEAARIVGKILF